MNFNTATVDAARPLMDRVLQIIPGAVIAGGYLRDAIMGREVRDMDVFTEIVTIEQLQDLGRFLADDPNAFELVPHDAVTQDGDYIPEVGRSSRIIALYRGAGVDVIVVDDIDTHLEQFPDNISKVWYDRTGLEMTAEFTEGHENKRIEYRAAAGTPRLTKLQAKYPDYTVSFTIA